MLNPSLFTNILCIQQTGTGCACVCSVLESSSHPSAAQAPRLITDQVRSGGQLHAGLLAHLFACCCDLDAATARCNPPALLPQLGSVCPATTAHCIFILAPQLGPRLGGDSMQQRESLFGYATVAGPAEAIQLPAPLVA